MSNLAEKLKLRKLINTLKKYRGRHTELISVYVPKGYELSKIVQTLREEKGTATNIKDSKTSKAVQTSLEKMIQTLINIGRTPEKGLAIFSGNISEKENVENYQVFWISPYEEIKIKLYRCDQRFNLDHLVEMSSNEVTYGLIAMDKGEATVGLLIGSSIKPIRTLVSNVPGKHKTGGQSAQRFARIREGAAVEFYKRISQVLVNEFTFMKELKGILIGGPGTTKNNFYDGNYINEDLKKKLLGNLLDITYTNNFGLKELIDKGADILSDSEVMSERKILQEFFETLATQTNKVSYGFENTKNALEMGAVKKLIILDEKISDNDLELLSSLAETSKTEINIITNKTPEGKQYEGLSGVGGILRFPIEV